MDAGTLGFRAGKYMASNDAIWGAMGYTVLLTFMLFKTGGIAKSVFGAH